MKRHLILTKHLHHQLQLVMWRKAMPTGSVDSNKDHHHHYCHLLSPKNRRHQYQLIMWWEAMSTMCPPFIFQVSNQKTIPSHLSSKKNKYKESFYLKRQNFLYATIKDKPMLCYLYKRMFYFKLSGKRSGQKDIFNKQL